MTMGYDRINITEKIIKLTLKILHLLLEEDYMIMKESGAQFTVSSHCSGYRNSQSPNMESPSHIITPEKKNYEIIKATNKISELLTQEVPIRCQDVTVYFSMDEWEYLNRHKRRYGSMMTKKQQPLASPDPRHSDRTCPSPTSSPYGMDEDYDIVITATNHSVAGDQMAYFAKMSTIFEGEHLPNQEKHTNKKYVHGIGRNIKNTALCKGKMYTSSRDHTYALPYANAPALLYEQGYQPDLHVDCSSDGTEYSTVDKKSLLLEDEHLPLSDLSSYVDSKEYIKVCIKDDPYICKAEELPLAGSSTSEKWHQDSTTVIKEETIPYEELPPYSSTCTSSAPVQFNSVHIKEEPMSPDLEAPAEIELYVDGTHCPPDHPKKPKKPGKLKQISSEKRPYSCTKCGKRFKTNSGLGRHKKIHGKDKMYTCHDCIDSFYSRTELEVHRKIHTEGQTYSCSECGRHFSKASNLSNHQRIHATKNPFSCAKCGKRFISNSNLCRHLKKHDNNLEPTEFAGSDCGKEFNNKQEEYHAIDKPYPCTECGKSFIKRINLVKHQRLHTKKNLHCCQECGKYFMSKAYLLRHVEGHSKKRRPFSCQLCGKFFLSKLDLAIHQRIHKSEKPNLASEWRKSFIRKLGFVIQERSNVGEKPYLCSECGEQFEKKLQLLRHQKMHKEQKPGGMAQGAELNDMKDVDVKCNVVNTGKE